MSQGTRVRFVNMIHYRIFIIVTPYSRRNRLYHYTHLRCYQQVARQIYLFLPWLHFGEQSHCYSFSQ